MRRKDDMNIWWAMWWFAVIVFLSGVFCTLTGCVASTELPAPAEPDRFEITYSQYFPGVDYVHIIRDHDTDDEYLFFKSGYGGGLALMPEKTVEEETFTASASTVFGSAPPAEDHSPEAAKMVEEPAAGQDETPAPAEPELLGWFTVTAYCPCVECCGVWSAEHPSRGEDYVQKTASGTIPAEGRTIAVDPDVIPYGTTVYFEGPDGLLTGYVAEDCGGAINGNDIDLYFESHEAANRWGIRELDVFVMPEVSE